MPHTRIRCLALITGFLAIVSPLLVAYAGDEKQDRRPAATARALETIQHLKWMHGEWTTKVADDTLEETWSKPTNDSLMGMFRWVKPDGVWMLELMNITADGDNVNFRLKHFSRDLVGWEAKDESLEATLVKHTDTQAVFEGDRGRFAFELKDEILTVRVGRESPLIVRYQRKK